MSAVASAFASAAQLDCPSCGAPTSGGDTTPRWCPTCEWGAGRPDAADVSGQGSRSERNALRRTSRLREALLAEAEAQQWSDNQLARSRPTVRRRALVVTLAILALLPVLACVCGFALLAWSIFGWWTIPALAVLLVLDSTWLFRRRCRRAEVTSVADSPHLSALLGRVAAELGTKPPHLYRVSGQFGASVFPMRGPWFRRVYGLDVGAMLWSVLDEQQRVALLGHELAHDVNSDLARGWLVHRAMLSLEHTYVALHPDDVARLPMGFVVLPFAAVVRLWCRAYAHLLDSVTMRDSQSAELRADLMAARVGGSSGAIHLMEVLMCGAIVNGAAEFAVLKGTDPWRAGALRLGATPECEIERQIRIAKRERHCTTDSHPQTAFRCQILQSAPQEPARVQLSPEQDAAIDAELDVAMKRAATVFAVSYRNFHGL